MAWGLWDQVWLGVPVSLRVCWARSFDQYSPLAISVS